MGKTNDTAIPLLPNGYYHLFNRGNNKQNIFYQERNYPYFLSKYADNMANYFDTFAYCLLPNHFHLLIRIKPLEQILRAAVVDLPLINQQAWKSWNFNSIEIDISENQLKLASILEQNLTKDMLTIIAKWAVSEKLRRWLMGYAKAINKQENLEGSLFRKKIRRKKIEEQSALLYLVWYIHNNPVHHNIFPSLQEYTHSSYITLTSYESTRLNRSKVLEWYGGVDQFIAYHRSCLKMN